MGWWKPISSPSFLAKIWPLFSSDFGLIHDAFLFALLHEKKVLLIDYLLMEFLDFQIGDLSVDSNFAKPLLTSLWTCRIYQILCLTSDMNHLNHYKFPLAFFCQEASLCKLWSSLFFYLFFLPIDKNIIRIWIYFFLFCYHFLLRKIYHILSIFFIIFLTK